MSDVFEAWRVHELGDPSEVLRFEEVEAVPPGPGQVVVEVSACAVNFADTLLCRGTYQDKPPLPFTPGLEVCGRVVEVGPAVEGARRAPAPGDKVLALPTLPHGGLATRALAAVSDTFAVPEDLDDTVGAALPVTYQTGWFGLHHRAGLEAGETVLVHAGAGGVGSAAIQLAKAAGARVIATAGGPEKVRLCRDLGADAAVDYRADDFVAATLDLTDGRGADVIYDSVGGDTFDRSRRCIAFEGRLVVVGFAGGRVRGGSHQPPAGQELQRGGPALGSVPLGATRPGPGLPRGADAPAGRRGHRSTHRCGAPAGRGARGPGRPGRPIDHRQGRAGPLSR